MKPTASSVRVRDLAAIFAALLILLALSAASVLLPPARWKTAAALGVAAAKAGLIAAFFMKLKQHRGLLRVFAGAGLFWLAIFAVLLMTDYLTRGWR
jgi:cytochrome c oxidase subunit IV